MKDCAEYRKKKEQPDEDKNKEIVKGRKWRRQKFRT
jgi:hypothetical protein